MKKSHLDWSLSNAELSRRTGLDPSTICRQRKSAGVPPVTPKPRVDWSKADWTLTDRAISEALNTTVGAVVSARHRRGLPRVPATSKFEKVDWTKDSELIASEMGVSLSSVYAARSRHGGARKAPRKERKLPEWAAAKLSERKTVHQWLNAKGVPTYEDGKPLCLLRRLAIALEIHAEPQ